MGVIIRHWCYAYRLPVSFVNTVAYVFTDLLRPRTYSTSTLSWVFYR